MAAQQIDLEIALRKLHELAQTRMEIWGMNIGTASVSCFSGPLGCRMK